MWNHQSRNYPFNIRMASRCHASCFRLVIYSDSLSESLSEC